MSITLVSTATVGSGGAASIDFTGIAGTGTDLLLIVSGRFVNASAATGLWIQFNNATTNQSVRILEGNGTTASSFNDTKIYAPINAASSTSNTFGNMQFYIPNYAGSTNKSVSIDSVMENNATLGYQDVSAALWSNTAAITSITLKDYNATNNLAQYSTASLYFITKGSGGATVS
jgi:hypothetical protein